LGWFFDRSPEQVAERLDKLAGEIREIQRPFMRGEKPADVLLVRLLSKFHGHLGEEASRICS